MVWDLNVAPAVGDVAGRDEPCRPNPYGLYRRGCAARTS